MDIRPKELSRGWELYYWPAPVFTRKKSWLEQKKIIGLNKLDFGDLIFPWKSGDGKEISNRYYHAFGHVELKRLSRKAGFKRIIVKKDPHNYWLILKN